MYSYHGLLIRPWKDGSVRYEVAIEHGGGRVGHSLLDIAFEIYWIVCRLAERPQCLELYASADVHLLLSVCLPLQRLCSVSAISTLYATVEDRRARAKLLALSGCHCACLHAKLCRDDEYPQDTFHHAWSFDELQNRYLQILHVLCRNI